jgi:hypothetical protein
MGIGMERVGRPVHNLPGEDATAMSLLLRERRLLRAIEAGICCSDPDLASWMAFFSRLTADEDMPGHERGTPAIVRIGVAVWAAAAAVFCVVVRAARACLHAVAAGSATTGHYGSPYGGHYGSPYGRHGPPEASVPWYWYRYR